jgi:ABC-2 type transport system permease protein
MLIKIREMMRKEFLQVLRDPRYRFILVAPLIVQILLYGYAANYEVHQISTAVLDLDHSPESRELISRFSASNYFRIVAVLSNRDQIEQLIERGKVALAIQVLPDFAEKLRKGQTAHVAAILDGTNSNTALVALGYIDQIGERYAIEYQNNYLGRSMPGLLRVMPSVELDQRSWFNTDLKSAWFFVPATIGLLMMAVMVSMTALTIVREREIGTLEQLMVTPIRPFEFILGKTIPNFLIALAQMAMVAAIGIVWFQVPFRGSPWVLALGSVLYLISTLALGLLISTISRTQQQALVASFFLILPASILSGFSFPITSMPAILQWLTYLDPLRYYLVVLRATFLKGIGLNVLWPQMMAMSVLAGLLLIISISRFTKTLD